MYLPPGPDLAWKGQYISLPAATLKAPVEGNRTVPVEITWLRDGTPPSYAVVFNAREQRVTPITQISAVHISNIHSAVPVRLLFPDTGFEIELGSNLEGYYPVVTNGLEFVAYTPLTPSGSDGVTIQVLNFLPPPLVFGLSPGGTVAGVSRIDTAAPLAGGPITSSGNISLNVPLAIQYGGTGAVTPDLAMDALAETGGSTVGLLSRNAAGNWVMQPLAAAGPPALPVSILNGGSGATTGFLALDNLSAAGSQTGVLQRVAGGNWSLSTAGTGTITGVTAGPGLSGGGGSGVVTLGLSIPVSYANGGTNATSRNGAMDSLTTASGADAGILTRNAAGNWGLDLGGLDIANGGTGAVTAAAALTNLGAVPLAGGTMTGVLIVDANATVGPVFTTGANSTTDAAIELGGARTASGNAHLDLHSEVGNDFELRILRAAGINGDASVQNAGTGAFNLVAGVYGASMSGTTGNIVFPGQIAGTGTQARKGTPGPTSPYQVNIDWAPGGHLWIDNVDAGLITVTCDYRIKENVADLPSTWDRVKALRPITYNRADNPELLSVADPTERWGFIAHELQEALTETAASGYKDAPNEVQGPDTLAVLAAVTKALQEAMTRIESLEARQKEEVS